MKFSDACLNTADYLASEEFKTREDAHRTNKGKFVPLLIEINELEYLTFDSQEGFVGIPTQGKFKGKKTMSERAYVCGFMEEKRAREFCMNLNGITDKVAFIVEECEESSGEIPVTISHIPPRLTKPIFEKSDTKEYRELAKKESKEMYIYRKKQFEINGFSRITRITTTQPKITIENEWISYVKLSKKQRKGHCIVICLDPKWNRRSDKKGGLLLDIIKSLERI